MIVLVIALTYPVVVLQNLGIEVKSWKNAPLPNKLAPNSDLEKITKIQQGGGESIVFDANGENIYASNPDGLISKYNLNTKKTSNFVQLSKPLGLAFDKQGNLVVCDAVEGLLSVSSNKETRKLVNEVEGRPITFANNLDISNNGEIYFSDSTTITLKNESGRFDAWGAARIASIASLDTGRLIKFDPKTLQAKNLVDGLVFANGVSLSHNEEFVLVAETGRYRIVRYWLKGEKAGTTDVFAENLPGFPDGIRRGSGNTYWVALAVPRSEILDSIHPSRILKEATLFLPTFLLPKEPVGALVLQLDENGKIINSHQDLTGAYPKISQAVEHEGKLYLGSVTEDHIAVYDLSQRKQ